MDTLAGAVRYAFRQFWHSRVFTVTAVLTLALGIGDGDDCCVEGGPQERWGMFSFPLFERLKAEAPEFEQLTAFQAGGAARSVRREGAAAAARALRSEFVTGNYFSTL